MKIIKIWLEFSHLQSYKAVFLSFLRNVWMVYEKYDTYVTFFQKNTSENFSNTNLNKKYSVTL